jgi:integrase/recombinase XerD
MLTKNEDETKEGHETTLPAALPAGAEPAPPRTPPLLPERNDFLEGDAPAAAKVEAFLTQAFAATGGDALGAAGALVPWICDTLLSNHSVKAYGRDLMDFLRHMQAQGVAPLEVTADHVKLYKRALLEAGRTSATVARRLSVIRGAYKELAAKGFIAWETAQDIDAVKAPEVQKNSTPSLTQRQAIALLEAIPTDTLQGMRDLALMSVFFITGCRVSAIVHACVGHLETDGVEHYLHVTEKRNKKRRKILLDAARPLRAYLEQAGIADDKEGPLFRPMRPDGAGLERRHLDRKTPWRLVKKYCRAAGIDPERLGGRGIGIHSLRKTAINDAIRNGATLHEVREFAGHADIRTTEVYFVRKEEDAEVAARRIHIRLTGRKGE